MAAQSGHVTERHRIIRLKEYQGASQELLVYCLSAPSLGVFP